LEGRFAAWGGAGLGKRRKGEGREGEVEGREREGPKLLLNQGPSEPRYATGFKVRAHRLTWSAVYATDRTKTPGCTQVGIYSDGLWMRRSW